MCEGLGNCNIRPGKFFFLPKSLFTKVSIMPSPRFACIISLSHYLGPMQVLVILTPIS